MIPGILDRVRSVVFPTDRKSRNQLYVFLVCLVLSIFIWMLIKLSEENVSEVRYPVELVNLPEGKILVEGSNQYLNIGFEEKASDIFFIKFIRKRKPVSISLANMPLRKKGSRYTGVIFPSHLTDYITRQQQLDYSIVSISPDTLRFVFEDKVSKKVTVVPNVEFSLAKQMMLYDSISIEPDSVVLTGPESSLESISSVSMEPLALLDLQDSAVVSSEIIIPGDHRQVSPEPKNVKVIVPVEEFTEAITEVRVVPVSEQFSGIKIFPETIRISYWVALSDYNEISQNMFEAVSYIDEAMEKGADKAPVILEKVPPMVKNVRLNPNKVEFIIIRQ